MYASLTTFVGATCPTHRVLLVHHRNNTKSNSAERTNYETPRCAVLFLQFPDPTSVLDPNNLCTLPSFGSDPTFWPTSYHKRK
jgi:hypothetical protein